MKAAVWHGRRDVRIESVPEPGRPARGQVQVQVAWCGICGTDLHEYVAGPIYIPVSQPHPLTGVRAPVIIGHEMVGRIIAVGEECQGFAVGDRVAACPIIGCGNCRWCISGSMAQCDRVAFLGTSWTGGALAQVVNLHAYQCFKLPSSITDEAGALVEPFSAAVRAVHRSAASSEDDVAVVGAGPIGLMAILALRILGVKSITAIEMSEARIEAARRCGASDVINPSLENGELGMGDVPKGKGFDLVLECAGQPSSALLAGRITRTRGRLTLMGVFDKPTALDLTDIVFKEKLVIGSMSGYGLYKETIQMMANPLFQPELLITDRIGLDELIDEGYQGLLERKQRKIKTLVNPN